MKHTFLWHDYETFGAQARQDRPAQFAAIRTDADLNEIEEPITLYCKPAPDFLPDPHACLITKITPNYCLEHGVPEHQFAATIEQAFSKTNTIGVGYNSIRFDDEITRFLFWRNLIDPYAREWQNNCGRWDIMDMVRTAYALRPDGINWPINEEGKPSFRLEHLTAANNITHDAAHDALSDVRATIALARLIKQKHAKLFDYCFSLHKKDAVLSALGLPIKRPFLHVSGMFGTDKGCIAVMWPIATHPHNKNEIIAWDLSYDPRELTTLSAETIHQRMFTKTSDLSEGETRLPIKSIHINKSPIVINNINTLSAERAKHWSIDMEVIQTNAQHAKNLPNMHDIWEAVFKHNALPPSDVDEALYQGFTNNSDKRSLESLRVLTPEQLARSNPHFDDARLTELFFRYRARNFPITLTTDESAQWEAHLTSRLLDEASKKRTIPAFLQTIGELSNTCTPEQMIVLDQLRQYAIQITPKKITLTI